MHIATRLLLLLVVLLAAPSLASAQRATPPGALYQPGPNSYFVLPPPPPASRSLEQAAETTRSRKRWELIVPGIVGFVGGYVGWFVTTIGWNLVNTTCRSSAGGRWGLSFPTCSFNGSGPSGEDIMNSLIPLVGPWFSVGGSETINGVDYTFPVIAGVVQAAGLAMLIYGVVVPASDDSPVQVEIGVSPTGVRLSGYFD